MGKQSRLRLHSILEGILGSKNVYFQPPENMRITYPCIIYNISSADTKYASNLPYKFNICYQITFISRDPDDDIREKIAMLPMCKYDRQFRDSDVNHDIFKIYI